MCKRLLRYAFLLLLLYLPLFFVPAMASASGMRVEPVQMVSVPMTDLEELQSNLDRLSVLSDSLQQTCGRQKNQIIDLQTSLAAAQRRLAAAQKQQTALQLQIRTLTENSQKQEALLTEANESFARYSKEQKRTRLRVKSQRNAAWTTAGILAIGLILK